MSHGMQGSQDVWGFEVQGLGAGSVQSPDDSDDEGSPEKGVKPGHTLKDFEVRGLRRPHRRVSAHLVSKGVLSIDLAGPYTAAYPKT